MDVATVSVWLLNTLLLGCALFALIHPAERAQLRRGLDALHAELGGQFLGACGGVVALLLWAAFEHLGALVALSVLMLLLVAVKAHDLGAHVPEPTELDNDVPPVSDLDKQLAARAAADFVAHAHDRWDGTASHFDRLREQTEASLASARASIDALAAIQITPIEPASLSGLVGLRAVSDNRAGSEL